MWLARSLVLAVLLSVETQSCTAALRLLGSRHTKGRGISEDTRDASDRKEQQQGRLDVVLTHYHEDRFEPVLTLWTDFMEADNVKELRPRFFIYCQNERMTTFTGFEALLKHGGEVLHLPNVGRETHGYLQYILAHYDKLPDHVLFSQDLPEPMLMARFQKMFGPKTGFLPLAVVGHADCFDDFLPAGALPQLYSMFANQLCPPEGFTAAFNGEFVVSRERIRRNEWWTYQHLLDFVAAPEDHWIHALHNNQYYKDRTNPLFGHAMERAWSLAFNCFESWREANCLECDNDKHMEDCGGHACQCFDQ